jgi:hypothetical protein
MNLRMIDNGDIPVGTTVSNGVNNPSLKAGNQ